jgi:hypothetical protein
VRTSADCSKIVETGPPPYEYDEERWIFVQDVFPDNDTVIEHALLAAPMAYEKAQTTILINGNGGGVTGAPVDPQDFSKGLVFCNDTVSFRFKYLKMALIVLAVCH